MHDAVSTVIPGARSPEQARANAAAAALPPLDDDAMERDRARSTTSGSRRTSTSAGDGVAVLVVQHQADAPPALLADAPSARGLPESPRGCGRGDALPDWARPPRLPARAVVVLGSDASRSRRPRRTGSRTRSPGCAGSPRPGRRSSASASGRRSSPARWAAPSAGCPCRRSAGSTGARATPPGFPRAVAVLARRTSSTCRPARLAGADAAGRRPSPAARSSACSSTPRSTPSVLDDWIAAYDGRELAGEVLDVAALRAATARHAAARGAAGRRLLFDAWLDAAA